MSIQNTKDFPPAIIPYEANQDAGEVQSNQGTLNLEKMPQVVVSLIASFNADSLLALRAVSTALMMAGESFLLANKKEIISDRFSSFLLFNHINKKITNVMQFHLLIPEAIRQEIRDPRRQTISYPSQILNVEEIFRLNEDADLQRMWQVIIRELQSQISMRDPGYNRPLPGVPDSNAPANEIRTWMQANQPRLKGCRTLANHFDLDRMRFTCVPKEIGFMPNLRNFNFSNNMLTFLPQGIFQQFDQLEGITLGRNQLTSLPATLLLGCVHLRSVELSGNQFTTLPEELFQGLDQLVTLWIVRCQLDTLPEGLFQGLPRLTSLFLGDNRLVYLPERLFEGLDQLERVDLQGNPGLLICYGSLPESTNKISILAVMREFFNDECESPFAQFYQLAARHPTAETLRPSLDALPFAIKDKLFGLVWAESGCPIGDPHWGENHVFDDMQVFGRALKRYVRDSFEGLDPEQKQAVYFHVYEYAKNGRASEDANLDEPNWGGVHAHDNILRLIDAMMKRLG